MWVNCIRIGITSALVNEEIPTLEMEITGHQRALKRAGAEPVILRNDMDPLGVIDELGLRGIVFSGGGDIDAAQYGGDERLANDRVNPQRDAFELALMEHVFESALPVLAICRGMQVANVLLGGTLIEDIRHHLGTDYALPHHQVKDAGLMRTAYAHEIAVASGTMLYELVGAAYVPINSFHHQALGRVAPALHATARSSDGVIEAVEFAPGYVSANGRRGFFIGVQWHPEVLSDDLLSQHLFMQFMAACTAR
jgi:putative glutamine amidotransferase